MNLPTAVVVDASGNVYFADTLNHRIRKIDTGGFISTIAGTGTAGFSGDGGPATLANLFVPQGVAVDSGGNVYISDFNNARIRKVDSSGIITSFAGNGTSGLGGDGGPATNAPAGEIPRSVGGQCGECLHSRPGQPRHTPG
jgi:hypothetical protein